jgi:cilia- and flagella-associated protein 57
VPVHRLGVGTSVALGQQPRSQPRLPGGQPLATRSGLCCRHSFGFRPDVHNSIHWLEGPVVAYAVGHSVVLMDTEHKTQRFIPCTHDAARITALAVAPNLRHLAVAEAPAAGSGASASITIFELATLKRRKALAASECGDGDVVDLAFSPDSRLLLAQGGAPEWTLALWHWEKGRVTSTMRTGSTVGSVLSARFCPNDSGHISVLSSNFVKSLRSSDGMLKAGQLPLAKRDAQEYTCQCWLADDSGKEKLVVGCASGELLLIESLDLKAVLHTEGSAPVDALLPWSKGFLVAQANAALAVFERDEREAYRRTKVFKFRETVKVSALALGAQEAQLALATEGGQILTLALGSIEILKPEEDNFELLCGALPVAT